MLTIYIFKTKIFIIKLLINLFFLFKKKKKIQITVKISIKVYNKYSIIFL